MLLVSIHDVSPAQEAQIRQLWDICSSHGVIPALLVVPDWHGQWPLEEHPDFVRWLRDRAQMGAEIVLHGERHDEAGLPRSAQDSLRAWGKTAREGEFLTLDETAARHRITRGLHRLRALGLDPVGFVPPAWLARRSIHGAVEAAGLAFSEDSRSIRLLPSGKLIRSPVVRWSSRSPIRAWGSVGVAGLRWVLQRSTAWPRIALHPSDLNHVATARSVQRSLKRWCGRHRPARYADLSRARDRA
jgi:predicted deacetylase